MKYAKWKIAMSLFKIHIFNFKLFYFLRCYSDTQGCDVCAPGRVLKDGACAFSVCGYEYFESFTSAGSKIINEHYATVPVC